MKVVKFGHVYCKGDILVLEGFIFDAEGKLPPLPHDHPIVQLACVTAVLKNIVDGNYDPGVLQAHIATDEVLSRFVLNNEVLNTVVDAKVAKPTLVQRVVSFLKRNRNEHKIPRSS